MDQEILFPQEDDVMEKTCRKPIVYPWGDSMAWSSRAKATKPAMTPTERAQSLHGGFDNFSQIGKTSWLINMYIYI
jgi:hypothetical protein